MGRVNLYWRQGPALSEQLAKLARVAADAGVVVAVAWIAGKPEPLAHLNRSGVPVFSDPVRCVKALAALLRWQAKRSGVIADIAAADVIARTASDQTAAAGDLTRFPVQEALFRRYELAMSPCALLT